MTNLSELTAKHIKAVNKRHRIINQEDACMPVEALGMDIAKWAAHRFDLIDQKGCQIDSVIWDVGLSSRRLFVVV